MSRQTKTIIVETSPEDVKLNCPSQWPTDIPAVCNVTQIRGANVTGNLVTEGIDIAFNVSG